MELLDEGNISKAVDAFRNEVKDNPENGYAYAWLGAIQYSNDEYGKALESLEYALKYIPKKDKSMKSFCYYKRAGVYRSLDKNDQAIADFSIALSLDPTDDDILRERAQIYYEQEKYELADADYKQMLQLRPNHPTAYMGLARNKIARKNFQEAADLLDNVVALYPDYASGYSFRAEAYIGLKRYREAASDIVTALEIDADDKAYYLMQTLADSAFVQINTKLKATAVTDPNNAYWPYCLGIINESTKKYNDAITHYQKAFKLDENAYTASRISNCYKMLGIWNSAIEYMDKAISIDERNTNFRLYKAETLYAAGMIESSIAELDAYIELKPDEGKGYYKRGWYKDNNNDIEGAIEDYTTCITLWPDYAYVYMSRGDLFRSKGMEAEAISDFEMAVQLDTIPEEGSCTMYALWHLGRKDEAIEWMNKMLASSDAQGIRYEAACLYSLMGENEKSLYYLEESLKGGNKRYSHIMIDSDLNNIKNTEAFYDLMKKYFPEENIDERTTNQESVEYEVKIVEIPFTRQGGVTKVKCSINDLPLHFIFDTGASTVSISSLEATFMYKNEYLTSKDIIGKTNFIDANGDISVGTIINLKKVTFGGLELTNVRASVVDNDKAPLLLGQSVLNRLGKIEIDYDRSILKITTKKLK